MGKVLPFVLKSVSTGAKVSQEILEDRPNPGEIPIEVKVAIAEMRRDLEEEFGEGVVEEMKKELDEGA